MRTNTITLLMIFLMTIFVFMLGCQNTNDKKTEGTKTPEPKAARKETPPQQSEKRKKKELIVYFADLMEKRQFVLQDTFEKHLQNKPGALRYNITSHGKKKSIFHHPLGGGAQNTISFSNIPIHGNTALGFDIGVFTEDRKNFASDGVAFKIVLWGDEMKQVIFEETVKQFDVWKTYVVDLSAHAGKNVIIDLLTEPLEHTLYDSAVWGSPGILNSSPDKEYEAVDVSSAKQYESIVDSIHGMPFAHEEYRVDRGWIADAATTDVLLSDVVVNTAIRTEIYVVKRIGEKDESLKIDVLDKNEKILASSTHRITDDAQEIVDEYQVNHETDLPHKIRIHRDDEMPSIVFMKVPVQFALRSTNSKKSRHNVILMSLDTLRADRLGCYGYSRDVSPNIDALAEESFIFTNTYSNSNWTLPAHTSMFTSLYPSQHQIVFQNANTLDFYSSEWPYYYVTEAFKESKYVTVAFTGGGNVGAKYGFHKGFDYYVENVKELNPVGLDLLTHLIEKNKKKKESPLFVFFHTYEIHDYHLEKSMYRKYVQQDVQRDDFRLIDDIVLLGQYAWEAQRFDNIRDKLMPEAKIQYIRNLYDSDISYTDGLLGRFFETLKEMELYDKTWIVITSDHGEGLGDAHKKNQALSWYHGTRLYNDQIRIPLIIKPPKEVMQKLSNVRSFDQFVQTIDIPPTLLSIIGTQPHKQFNGKTLFPLFTSPDPFSEEAVFSENIATRQFSIIKDGYKLIMLPPHSIMFQFPSLTPRALAHSYQLYDLRKDPSEKNNLSRSSKHAPIYNELKQLLEEHVQNLPSQANLGFQTDTNSETEDGELDPKELQRLKELGYL